MAYNVVPSDNFRREAKRLIKKFPSLRQELDSLGNTLGDSPTTGTKLANNCYKIRLAIASKNKGKSGGARVITHVHVQGENVFLLSIYDKSEREDITDGEITELIKQLSL
jgi:mRNA-degrading endonuclease RelE of RelBE toxin-antitoxin system